MFQTLLDDWVKFRKDYEYYLPGVVGALLIVLYWLLGLPHWVFGDQAPDFHAGWYLALSSFVCAILVVIAGRIRSLPLAVIALIFFICAGLLPLKICTKADRVPCAEEAKKRVESSTSTNDDHATETAATTQGSSTSTVPAPATSTSTTSTSGGEVVEEAEEEKKKKEEEKKAEARKEEEERKKQEQLAAVENEKPYSNIPWVFAFALSLVGMSLPMMVVRPVLPCKKPTNSQPPGGDPKKKKQGAPAPEAPLTMPAPATTGETETHQATQSIREADIAASPE